MLNRSTRNHLLPLLLSFALLVCYALPVTAKSVAERAKTEEPVETTESTSAVTMQLMKMEGDVSITNDREKDIFFLEKMRLYSGYHVETQEASYAWINLDGAKLTKLDAVSEMEVRKSSDGENLEILLNSGKLLFNVTEPLTDDETLKIRTSTMTVGIRGTSGWVEVTDRGDTRVYILEGTVECGVTDPVTGQTKETALSGGETADFLVYPQEQEGDKCDIIRYGFTEDDIDGFVLVEAVQDEELCREIYDACGLELMACADEAEERLKADQEEIREKLQEVESQLTVQENNISVDPVWGGESEGTGTLAVSNQTSKTTLSSMDSIKDTDLVPLPEEAGDTEETRTAEQMESTGGEGSLGNSDGSKSLEDSSNSGYPENTYVLDNREVIWSLDGSDLFYYVRIPDVTENAENKGGSGNTDNTGSPGAAVPDESIVKEEGILTVSEASVEKIMAAWDMYGTVKIVPDAGSSSGEWVVGQTLKVPGQTPRKNLVIDRGVKVTGDLSVVGRLDIYGEIEGSVELLDGDMRIYDGRVGTVNMKSVINDSILTITGGTVDNLTHSNSRGKLSVIGSGVVKNLTQSGGQIDINDGGAVENLTQSGGKIVINSGGTIETLRQSWQDSSIEIAGGKVEALTQTGKVTMTGGTVGELLLKDGTLTIEPGATIITLVNEGGTCMNNGGTIENGGDSSNQPGNTATMSDDKSGQSDTASVISDSDTDEADDISEVSSGDEDISDEEITDQTADADQTADQDADPDSNSDASPDTAQPSNPEDFERPAESGPDPAPPAVPDPTPALPPTPAPESGLDPAPAIPTGGTDIDNINNADNTDNNDNNPDRNEQSAKTSQSGLPTEENPALPASQPVDAMAVENIDAVRKEEDAE